MKKIFYSLALVFSASAFSYTANAQNELVVGDVKVGDKITLSDGSEWLVGTNEVINGNFDVKPADNGNNIVGWTIGNYAQMTTSTFLWHAEGGYDGGPYIQASKHTGSNGDGSICQRWAIEPNTRYYFSFYVAKNSANNQYIPVITLTSAESTGGGQNEKLSEGAKQLIGKNGEDSGEILGYANFIDEDGDGVGEWVQTACSFESEGYTYLQFNARWLKEAKIQACFDGVFLAKLYDPATTSPSMVAFLALQSKLREAELKAEDFADYEGIAEEIYDFIGEGEYNGTAFSDMSDNTPVEDIQGAIALIDAKIELVTASMGNISQLDKLLNDAINLLEITNYPGFDDLEKIVTSISDYTGSGYYSNNENVSATEYLSQQVTKLGDAINNYRNSQEASEDNPADYTYLVDQPNFNEKGAWYIGQSGGDQTIKTDKTDNEGNPINCWNAWRNNLEIGNSVSISQNLTGLRNGKYSLTADMNTQDGCITDQHLFANSAFDSAVSPVMTITGWNPCVWETLTTGIVIVTDGKLTIGAIGNGDGEIPADHGGTDTDKRRGWFNITNVKLNFLGDATDAEVEAAKSKKFQELEDFAASMGYAADKAEFQSAIDNAKSDGDFDALNQAKATAETSQNDYNSVQNGTLKTLTDKLADYSADCAAIVQVAIDATNNYINSSSATYKETGDYTAILRYYNEKLIPAIQSVESAMETASNKGKSILATAIANVKSVLSSYTSDTAELDIQIKNLNYAIYAANASDIEYGAGKDVTAYINNPTIENTGTKVVPAGWEATMSDSGNDFYTNTGQQYDGKNGYYIDAWNGTAGMLKYNAFQTINVPNGTYTLNAMMRTTGEGFYLYAIADGGEPVLKEAVAVPTKNAIYTGVDNGEEATVFNDSYGEFWMAAADKVVSALGITNNPEDVDGGRLYDLAVEINDGSNDCPEKVDATDWAVFSANAGKGRGWFEVSLDVEVKNHVLTIGVATGDAFADAKTFEGTWFSADNFKLIMNSEGDNTGWDPAATDVESIEIANAANATSTVYSVAGARSANLQKGVNIVKYTDGSVKKVLVK